jgi:hypothetical protein
MKKLKSTKELRNDIEHIELLLDKVKIKLQEINISSDYINKEYAKNINKLLEEIAKGEQLDIKMLKSKYLKSSSKLKVELVEHKHEDQNEEQVDTEYDYTEDTEQIEVELQVDNKKEILNDKNTSDIENIIFDKIIIDGLNYYYENKENGKIYDTSSNIVGIYKDKKFKFSNE